MELLKIGTLNIPQNRWEDALDIFSEIIFLVYKNEKEFQNEKFKYLKFKNNNKIIEFLNNKMFGLVKKKTYNKYLCKICIIILRILNKKLLDCIKDKSFKYVHVSYNDFDESNVLFAIFYKEIKNAFITRAYKESRPGYNYLEYLSLKNSNRIVLNDVVNYEFFKKKYSDIDWDKKEIVLGVDEDYRSEKVVNNIVYSEKKSVKDNKIHIVILAGTITCDNNDKRFGSRLNYIPLVKSLIANDFVVHIHCINIRNDINDVNQYKQLEIEYKNNFFIEKPLDFEKNYKNAYKKLSEYDYGILHNFGEDQVAIFDKINIPHRFYEYQNAHVIPIVKEGETILIEKIISNEKCGFIYKDLKELKKLNELEIKYSINTFKSYMEKLYGSYKTN